uniref:Uncharacterized protein MANES_18G120700 n=1 Tax=Rhizophora mucronata TaxID=61149 RepID=A0A2P2MHH4_RHIMU
MLLFLSLTLVDSLTTPSAALSSICGYIDTPSVPIAFVELQKEARARVTSITTIQCLLDLPTFPFSPLTRWRVSTFLTGIW